MNREPIKINEMKIIKNFNNNYPEDPIRFFNFEKYSDLCSHECILYIGGSPHPSIFENNNIPKYFLSTEEQSWNQDSTDLYVNHVNKIFTICPPSITKRNKRKFTFFPIDEDIFPKQFQKENDVIYAGFAQAAHVNEILNTIKNFNYRFISFSKQTNLETDINVNYLKKLDIISKSKISVIHNLTGNGTPQLKSRPFESALCKSLILCKQDSWNIINEWYEKDKEYISYIDANDLNNKIKEILNNYEKYNEIVENAYLKTKNKYTSKNFITDMINKENE